MTMPSPGSRLTVPTFKRIILETIIEANSISNEEIALLLTSDKSEDRIMGELYAKWKNW